MTRSVVHARLNRFNVKDGPVVVRSKAGILRVKDSHDNDAEFLDKMCEPIKSRKKRSNTPSVSKC